jgi:spore maturation protein CgeB
MQDVHRHGCHNQGTALPAALACPPEDNAPDSQTVVPDSVALPADPPRRLLFLSDCYAQDVVWGPFHKTMLAYCGAAFERVRAIRANAFFHPWSHRPCSAEHLACVRREIQAFAPDLIFSINRAGLAEQALAGVHPAVKAITVFVDYYDRLDDSMHQYGPRDLVWGTGTPRMRAAYLSKYAGRLRPEQAIHTLWGVDHHLFYPHHTPRTTDIVFVGTPFNPEAFVNLVDAISLDEHNRRVFLETYEAHRQQFIYDWVEALRRRGFAFDRLPPVVLPQFENFLLQGAVGDQISIENRITFLAALAGLDVKIYGDSNRQWIHDFSLVNAHMLKHFQFRAVTDPAELVHLYSSARIGINIQHDHARGHGLSFRVFDLLACKTLLATHADSRQVLDELGFVEDQDYVCFHDPATLRRKCEFYLEHEDRRRAIAEAGYARVLSRHTLAHRFAEVFSGFGFPQQAACYRRLCQGNIRTLLDAEKILREKVTTLEPLPTCA